MRTKHLFLALALPAVFAACSNEEFVNDNATPVKGDLVELGEGFALAGQGINNASTRGLWELEDNTLSWLWLPKILANNTGANSMMGNLNVVADEIGLCWTGELPDGTGSISNKVYTNYQFLHDGWLAEGQNSANFEECPPYALQNGKVYKTIVEGTLNNSSNIGDIKTQLTNVANQVTINATPTNLDLNTGIFTTDNKAIFGGSYIVYYPYNSEFADAASLPATSPASYEDVEFEEKPEGAHVAKNTFLVGYAKDLIGGSQASKFSLNPLSAIISLQLRQLDGSTKTIEKVALWSENGFVTNVNLDASKIKASGAAAGEALYVGEKETSSTIVATLNTPTPLETPAADAKYKKLYLPILPTTLKGLKVVVYANDKSIAVKELAGEYKFSAAAGKSVKVDLKEADFKKNVLIAVDAASFKAAAEGTYTEANPATVTVIGDITLNTNVTIKEWATVKGGKIIVPEDMTLTVEANANIESEVDVEGLSCCNGGTNAGKMTVSGTVAGKVNLLTGKKATGNKSGELEFTGGKATATSNIVANEGTAVTFTSGNTDIFGTLTIEEGATATVKGNSMTSIKGGVVNNNGEFEVETSGDFGVLDKNGNAEPTDGENFKNNGKFIDNVSAKIGGATQYMVFGENGEYICRVADNQRMNEAYKSKYAASTIEIVGNNGGKPYTFDEIKQHNGKDLNIINSVPTVQFEPKKAITIGNLTVVKGLIINKTLDIINNNKHEGWATINVNGDIDVIGGFVVKDDVRGMKAGNLIVGSSASIQFDPRKESNDKTLEISKTITVKKGGVFRIVTAGQGENIALVTCRQLINESGKLENLPEVVK